MLLAQLYNYVERRYGMADKQLLDSLADLFMAEMDAICRKYSLWFMNKEPDPDFITNFPITSGAALADSNYCMAQGWLYTLSGKSKYELYAPYYKESATTRNKYPAYWLRHTVKHINYATVYDASGNNTAALQFVPYADILRGGQFSSSANSEPQLISIYNEGINTPIVLYPEPDDEYYIALGYTLMKLPKLIGPESTNDFMTYYPDVAMLIGQMIAAKHNKNWDEYGLFQQELYGQDRDSRVGGRLRDLLRDSQSRSKDSVLRTYSSEANAKGSMNVSVHFSGNSEVGSDGSYFL